MNRNITLKSRMNGQTELNAGYESTWLFLNKWLWIQILVSVYASLKRFYHTCESEEKWLFAKLSVNHFHPSYFEQGDTKVILI